MQKNLARQFGVFLIALLILAGGFALGLNFQPKTEVGQNNSTWQRVVNRDTETSLKSEDIDFKVFWEAWNLIRDKYVDKPVSERDLFYGALSGMVAALGDQHSIFLDPPMNKEFTDDLKSEFEGIGAEIGLRDGQIQIVAPLPETPAEKAGLRAKDIILKIDGRDTTGFSSDQAVSLIRGKKNTQVKLLVMREDFKEPQEFILTRSVIKFNTVKWEMKSDGIAYLKLSAFNEKTEEEFSKAVTKILAEKPKGLVLDLRNNPGGFFQTAITVANYWISEGIIVKEKASDGTVEDYKAPSSTALLKDLKTIVLVNGGSASASEIVAGALRDHQKAVIVGEKTFGKGSVQSLSDLSDGSAIKVTIARWETPNGTQIDKVGLAPDTEVKYTEEDVKREKDPQLDKALELLK